MSIKISIIVPVYNREFLLPKCLESLLNQTLKGIEVILINDGSTDNSGTICDEYVDKFPGRFKYFYTPNGGVSRARNYGITKAQGEYIGFVDCDDWLDSSFCEVMYAHAIKNQAQIVTCNIDIVSPNQLVLKTLIDKIADMKDFTLHDFDRVGSVCNKIFQKKLIDQYSLRFIEDCHYAEDLAFAYCAGITANKIIAVQDSLYKYYQNPQSVTMQPEVRKTFLKELYSVIDYTYSFLMQNQLMDKAFYSFNQIFINEILQVWCPRAIRHMKGTPRKAFFEYMTVWNKYVMDKSIKNYIRLIINYFKFEIFRTCPRFIKFLKSKI